MKPASHLMLTSAIAGCLLIGFQIPLSAQTTQPAEEDVKAEIEGLQWVSMSPTGARASFEMPEKPRYIERRFPPIQNKPPIKVRLHLCTVNEGKTTYVFGYHDLHETPRDKETTKNTLDGAVRGSVVNVFGQLIEAEAIGMSSNPRPIKYGNNPGREFVYRFAQNEKPFLVTARIFLVGRRQYQLSCIMAEDLFNEILAVKFLNSFRLIVPESDLPPRPRVPN